MISLFKFNNARLSREQDCVAFVHVIFNKVESKQASRAFATPTTLNVPHDFTSPPSSAPPFLCPLLLDCRLPSRFLVPSHRLSHNLFRLQVSFRVPFFFLSLFLQSRIIPQIARLFDHPESPVVLALQPDALRSILVFVIPFSRIPFVSGPSFYPRESTYM